MLPQPMNKFRLLQSVTLDSLIEYRSTFFQGNGSNIFPFIEQQIELGFDGLRRSDSGSHRPPLDHGRAWRRHRDSGLTQRSNQPVISDRRVLDCLLAESTDLLSRQVSKWSVVPLGFSKSSPLPDDFPLAAATT